MKKKQMLLAVLLAGAAWSVPVFSRDARSDIQDNPLRVAGVYYAYPTDEISPEYGLGTPQGYIPFYVSHYGRHGSRYLISDRDYTEPIAILRRASDAGALTSAGEYLLRQLDTVLVEGRGRGGELTPLGSRQHRGIARRLGQHHPEVFTEGAEVTAASTVVMRCAHSMFAFMEGLKELYPWLDIPRESSERDMVYLNYHSPESGPYSSHKGPYYQDYTRFRQANTRPERLMSFLFADRDYLNRWVDQNELMWSLYWLACDMQNMETDIDLYYIFTPDETYGLWQTANFGFFGTNCSYAPAEGHFTANAKNLLNNIIDNADNYIANGKHGATLRFGHDGNIIPLVALMKLDGCWSDITVPEDLASEYADFRVSPMAANLQMVFFRNPEKADTPDEVIVRIYLNEKDITLPVEPVAPHHYRWTDLRNFLINQARP